jgi:hypothetical protein
MWSVMWTLKQRPSNGTGPRQPGQTGAARVAADDHYPSDECVSSRHADGTRTKTRTACRSRETLLASPSPGFQSMSSTRAVPAQQCRCVPRLSGLVVTRCAHGVDKCVEY